MRETTDDQFDLDVINPYPVLRNFRLPSSIERGGDLYTDPSVLPESGAIEATDTAGSRVVFLAREATIAGRPLLEVAREAAETRERVYDCCHSTTST